MQGDFRLDHWLVQPQLNTIVDPDNNSVQLEPKVMEVLVFLADHAGEVVSKEILLQSLWGDTFVTENALTRCISELRKAFNDDAEEPRIIQTIAKRGYRLIAAVSKLKGPASRYEIIHKLGQGAMGEVFLAKDTELHRKVALKFVLEEKGPDEAGRKRLLREARAAAALDHPFICKVFDTGEIEGKTFIAMEYLEGQTLKQKLAKGRLEIKEALHIAFEIAEALESAHDKGIVHRDLKPSNIMLTGQGHVKVMDFGLAKRLPQADMPASLEETVSALTKEGTTAGTLPYMSPEQLRAETIDSRSDIFSFGIVLFEMIAGLHPFEKKSAVETAAAILELEPNWNLLPSGTPALIRALLRRCLQKDSARRQHYIADVRIEINDALSHPDSEGTEVELEDAKARMTYREGALAVPSLTKWIWLISLVVTLLAGTMIGWFLVRRTPPAATGEVTRFRIEVEPATQLGGDSSEQIVGLKRPSRTAFALTPDGRQLVYYGLASSGKTQFYLRRLDRVDATAISGTEGGLRSFLSPDGKWVAGFFGDGKVKKVPVEGGTPVTICEYPAVPFGASWGAKDVIVYSCQGRLWKVSASGGNPEAVTAPSPEKGDLANVLPCFLPGGDDLLFSTNISPNLWDNPRTEVLSLRTGERKILLEEGADARYLPTGHLVFARRGSLYAVPFDIDRLEVTGDPVAIVEDIMQAMNARNSDLNSFAAQFSVSASGALAYVSGGAYPDLAGVLNWIDRKGSAQPLISSPGPYFSPRISPDGRHVAYWSLGRQREIWVYDVERGTRTQLTFGGMNRWPLWTPDGSKVTYVSSEKTLRDKIFQMPFDGSGQAELLLEGDPGIYLTPASWSPDGKSLAIVQGTLQTGFDILVFHPEDRKIKPFLKTPFDEGWPAFSPDGRWLAYASNETKCYEVYVRPYPGPGTKITISTDGGWVPAWHPNGSELYFLGAPTGDRVTVVDTSTRPSFVAGKPRVLFAMQLGFGGIPVRGYDTDGKRFLAFERKEGLEAPPVTQINIVLNWFEELKRLVPTGIK